MDKIKVIVVDDSSFMRKVISQMLEESREIEVIGTAKDGNEALKKLRELKPDVVTLDVEMPRLNGLQTLGYIMSEAPTPVIMVSAYTPKGAEITFQALEYGAFDFVCKPSGSISIDIKKIQSELVDKIKAAKMVDPSKLVFITPANIEKAKYEKKQEIEEDIMVVIAASTGGPKALSDIVPRIPRDIPASFLIVQHMSPGFTKTLADRLNDQSIIIVKEAAQDDVIKTGTAYLAPGNYHMEIKENGNKEYCIDLNQKPFRSGVRPSADMTFFSVAENFKGRMIGVILTGMGKDGAAGLEKIKEKNGIIIAQDKETSVIYGMPKAAVDKGIVDVVVPVDKVTEAIIDAIEKR